MKYVSYRTFAKNLKKVQQNHKYLDLKNFITQQDGYQIVHLQPILESQLWKIMAMEIQIQYMTYYFMVITSYHII